jgi:hypothetical protein
VCLCCPWFVLAPKVLQLCTNHFVWVVCRPVWVSEACQLFLIPSRNSNTPLYPSKCYELGNVSRLLPLPMSSTWIHIWVLQGVGSASRGPCKEHKLRHNGAPFCTKITWKVTKWVNAHVHSAYPKESHAINTWRNTNKGNLPHGNHFQPHHEGLGGFQPLLMSSKKGSESNTPESH